MSKKHIGTFYIFISAILFSLGGLCIKLLPWTPLSINSGRSIISVTLIGTYMYIRRHKLRFNRYVLLGSLCMSATTTLYVFANKLTTAANTIVLQFTAPIFIILFMWLFYKNKPKRLDVITCVIVFGGIICFFIDGLQTGGMIGNLLAILSGATFAVVFMLNTFPNADPISSIIIGQAICAVVGIPFIAQETDFQTQTLVIILILGVFQLGLAYIFFSEGLKSTHPVTASLVSGVEPVMNPLLTVIFYGEKISKAALPGGIIVIITIVIYNILKSKSAAKKHKSFIINKT